MAYVIDSIPESDLLSVLSPNGSTVELLFLRTHSEWLPSPERGALLVQPALSQIESMNSHCVYFSRRLQVLHNDFKSGTGLGHRQEPIPYGHGLIIDPGK
jgi:hypothetical protein